MLLLGFGNVIARFCNVIDSENRHYKGLARV